MSAAAAPRPSALPPEADRWNWGGFLLTWIWGIGNNTLIALLALVPFVNFVMMFVLGAKGSEWAWNNKRWESVEHFRRVQRNWAIAGAIAWVALIGIVAASLFAIASALKNSDVYRGAIAKLNASAQAMQMLGAPVEPGFPMGSVSIAGPSGEAQLSIPVTGRIAKGTVYLAATLRMGRWEYDRIELEIDGREDRIDLNSGRRVPAPSATQTQAAREPGYESRCMSTLDMPPSRLPMSSEAPVSALSNARSDAEWYLRPEGDSANAT